MPRPRYYAWIPNAVLDRASQLFESVPANTTTVAAAIDLLRAVGAASPKQPFEWKGPGPRRGKRP